MPIQADYLSLEGLEQLMSTINKVQNNLNPELKILGILFCIIDRRMKMTGQSIEIVKDHFKDIVFDTMTRICVKLKEAAVFGQTIFEYAPRSTGAEDYRKLTEEIIERENIFYSKDLVSTKAKMNYFE